MPPYDAANHAKQLTERIGALSAAMAPIPTATPAKLTPIEGVRAVLFDVYGTMFVSGSGDVGTAAARDNAACLTEALDAAGAQRIGDAAGRRGVDALHKHIHTFHEQRKAQGVAFPEVDIRTIWQRVVAELVAGGVLAAPLPDAALDQLAVEYECRVNPVWPMPALLATLGALAARGLRLGIVSNAQFFTPLLFDALLGRSAGDAGFDPRLCFWSYQYLEAKPSTRLYELAVDRLRGEHDIEPSQTVYIGNDMRNDIWPASKCGMGTVLFAGDQRSLRLREDDAAVAAIAPTAAITRLDQLPELLTT